MSKNHFLALVFGSLAIMLSTFSCGIGLGEKVDTEAPSLEVAGPVANGVVRGAFTMNGTWKDDGEIGKVSVEILNTANKKSYTFPAVSSEGKYEGTWTCKIDPITDKISDGPYVARVTIADSFGHETIVSSPFVIDNTPPLLILSRPSTENEADEKGKIDYDAYGQIFNIAGQGADDNEIALLEVEFYDKDGGVEPIKTVSIQDVQRYIDINVAVWDDDPKKESGKDYRDIYGNEKEAGTKQFYCKIKAYDSATRIPAVTEEDKKGNCTDFYYLYNDIYTPILKKGYNATALYHILSGLYDADDARDAGAEEFEEIKRILLQGKVHALSASEASFSLNPMNNPCYDVAGYSPIQELLAANIDPIKEKGTLNGSEAAQLLNNSNVSIGIKAGLDGIPVFKDSLGVYLVPIDEYGDPTGEDEICVLREKQVKGLDKEGKVTLIDNPAITNEEKAAWEAPKTITTAGQGYSIVVQIGSRSPLTNGKLNLSGYYKFKIVGYDENFNQVRNSDGDYGFRLFSSGSVPILSAQAYTVDGATEELAPKATFDIKGGQSVKIIAIATIEEGEIELVARHEYETGDPKSYKFITNATSGNDSNITVEKGKSGENEKYTFTINLPNADFKDGANTLTITAKKVGETQQVDKAFTVNYDTQKPEVSDVTVDGAEYDTVNKPQLNGTITIKATATDNGIVENTYYKVFEKGKTPPEDAESLKPNVLKAEGFQIDTREYFTYNTLNKPESGYAEGFIVVQITAEDKSGNISEVNEIELKINQKSDIPKVDFAGSVLDNENYKKEDISYNPQRNIFELKGSIYLTVKDDDGLKSVKMSVKKEGDSGWTDITNKLPALTVGTKADYIINKKIVDELGLGEGYYTIRVEVEDTIGTYPESKFKSNDINIFIFDNPLSLEIWYDDILIPSETTPFNVSNNFPVILKVKEKDGNLEKIEYKEKDLISNTVGAATEVTLTDAQKESKELQSINQTVTVPASSTRVQRTYTATNKFGIQSSFSFIYNLDLDKPTLSDLKTTYYVYDEDSTTHQIVPKQNNVAYTSGTLKYDASKTFSASIVADDKTPEKITQTGISTVEYKIINVDKSNAIQQDWTDATRKDGKYNFQIPSDIIPSEGNWKISIRAKDNAGKESDITDINLVADKEIPEITGPESIKENSSKAVVLTGTVKETYLREFTVKVEKSTDGTTWTDAPTTAYTVTTPATPATYTTPQAWSVTVEAPDDNHANDGLYRVKLTAKDDVGKQSTWASSQFRIDTVAPVFDDSNFKIKTTTSVTAVEEAWFDGKTLKIEGEYTEEGSGIEEVRYTLKPIESDGTAGTPVEGEITAKKDTGGKYTFSSQVDGFKYSPDATNHNKIEFTVTDNAGNISATKTVNVKVDLQGPDIGVFDTTKEPPELKYIAKSKYSDDTDSELINVIQGNTKLVNGKKALDVYLPVKDGRSGIKEIKLSVGTKDFNATSVMTLDLNKTEVINDTEYGDITYYKCTIPTEKIATGPVYAQATDNAGNIYDALVFNFNKDDTKPNIVISSHKDDAVVNKKIVISGTAIDDQQLQSVVLEVSTDNGTTWKNLGTGYSDTTMTSTTGFTLTGTNWSYTLDTNNNTYSNADGTDKVIKLRATAYDDAKNASEPKIISLRVNQNSDRPIITLGLAKNGAITSVNNFSVTVEDDDGVDTDLIVKISTDGTKPTSWDTIAALDLTNGSGTFSYDGAGTKNLWFYVKDAKNGEFITNVPGSGSLSVEQKYKIPYVKFTKNGTQVDNNTNLSFIYDPNKPTITKVAYGFGETADAATTGAEASAGDNYATLGTSGNVFGGTKKKYIVLAVTPKGDNGIDNVTVTGLGDGITFTKPATGNGSDTVWYSKPVDVSKLQNGEIKIEAIALSGTPSAETSAVYQVDFTKPSFRYSDQKASKIAPKPNGTASDTLSTIETFNYLLLDNAYYSNSGVENVDLIYGVLKGDSDTTAPAGGNTVNGNGTLTKSDGAWSITLEGLPANKTDLEKYSKVPSSKDIYTMRIYFYLVDALGNGAEKEDLIYQDITYDPYGNRPSVEVNYPAGTSEKPAAVNGSIRVSGQAAKGVSGEDKIGEVYLQIDVDKDGDFDADDLNVIKGFGSYTIRKNETDIKEDLPGVTTLKTEAIGNLTDFWGIKVNGVDKEPTQESASWYLSINGDLEFQINGKNNGTEAGTYLIAARAVAVSDGGMFGAWSDPQYIKIDTNIPKFIGEPIITEKDATTNDVLSTRIYEQDMYLKGKNTITIKTVEKDGIKEVRVYTAKTKAGLNDASSATVTKYVEGTEGATPITDGSESGFQIVHELPTNIEGSYYIKVQSFKHNDNSAYEIYNVNFDNTAPKITDLKFNSVPHSATDETAQLIVNSNGKFTLGGRVEDEHAGYERVGFYIVRGDGKTYDQRIYDPMTKYDASTGAGKTVIRNKTGTTTAGAVVTGITEQEFGVTDTTRGSSPQKMYGATQTVTVGGTDDNKGKELTITADANIKKGGIVYIGGTFIKITGKDSAGTKLTLEKATTEKDTTSAFFPYMQFIDNTGAEKTDDTGLNVTSGDDGDNMPESIVKSQSKYDWDATLQSQNIPDGPCTVVMFAWDKAGNISAASFDASIQNHAPRLVKLHLGTDLNGNEKYSDSEFVSYDILGEVGKQSNYKDMQTSRYKGKSFRVKDKLAVVPEFVGGNGVTETTAGIYNGIKMVALTAAETDQTINKKSKEGVVSVGTPTTTLITSDTNKFDNGSTMIENRDSTDVETTYNNFVKQRNNIWLYEIPSEAFGGDSGESPAEDLASGQGHRAASFTFWDNTEDTTQGVDSSYCYLRITDLIVDVVDTDEPTIQIDPFYWNSVDDASMVYDSNGVPLGHIDLGARPKVSGQVYIRGTAYDNTKHGDIYIKAPDGITKRVSHYDGDKWNEVKTGWPDNWKKFEVTYDGGITQDGHEIEWQFEIDMTPYGVGSDKEVNVFAIDAQGNNKTYYVSGDDAETATKLAAKDVSSIASTQEDVVNNKGVVTKEKRTSRYVMDFVPYIKSVESVASANYTVRRSRLGRYPVRAGAKIRINGMNFAEGAAYSVAFYKTNTTGKQGDKNSWTAPTGGGWSGTIPGDGYIEITVPNYSCFVEVTVNNVKTPNNTNSNDEGYNIQKGKFRLNRETKKMYAIDDQPGEDFWTDDCYLSVWNVAEDTLFPGSVNPTSGVIKKVDARNSGSGAPSDAGADEPSAAPGPGGGQLYKQPGQSTQVDPVLDMTDNYYAAMASPDLKLYGYVSGKTYSDHGDNIAWNKSEVAYFVPVDEMDYTIVNGMPYYVFQDNTLGGDSGSVWGMGLVMMREGIWYDRDYFKIGNTIEEKDLPYFVERQGYDVASWKRDSSTGYDSVLHQFKNPRIAGWYNSEDWLYHNTNPLYKITGVDYIYISYYDSYAKCLKYAAYKVGHRFENKDHYANSMLKDWGKGSMNKDMDIVAMMTSSPNNAGNNPLQYAYDHMKDGKTVVAGNETLSSNPTNFTEVAGEWSDILIDPDDHLPIIVYYNMTKKCVEIAKGTTAFPDSSGWTKQSVKPEGTTDFGRYVSAAIDNAGNLHIAAQDADSAKLYYVYRTKASGYASGVSAAVDGSSGAGRWTDIELTNPAGTTVATIKPVISYINTGFLGTTSGVKVAYLESVEGTGSNAKLHFEAMTDPAQYTAGDQRTSVMASVYETKNTGSIKAPVAVGFNSDKLALDFLRGEE